MIELGTKINRFRPVAAFLKLSDGRHDPGGGGGGGGYSHIKWVCMCRPRLKRRGLTELIKLKKRVLLELKER